MLQPLSTGFTLSSCFLQIQIPFSGVPFRFECNFCLCDELQPGNVMAMCSRRVCPALPESRGGPTRYEETPCALRPPGTMMTSSWYRNISVLLALCEGNPAVNGEFPFVRGIQRSAVDSPHKGPVMRRSDVYFVVRLTKLLNKLSSCWWFHTYTP